jgi:uncharacterized membrane protein YdjX (TVP38/TMEM64 family)
MLKGRLGVYARVGSVLVIVGIVLLARFFPLVDLVADLQQRVGHWGRWSAAVYPLLFALCNLLLLPGGILSIGSGFFFGLWWGFAIIFVGNAVGAAAAFGLSRRLGQDWFRRRLANNATMQLLEPAVEKEGWKIVFLSQLHPLFPTSLINYFYGLTQVDFKTYMVWVSIGRAPGIFLYTYLGTLGQYGLNVAQGKTHPREIEYWIWGGAFVSTALLVVVLSRIAMRAIDHRNALGVNMSPRDQVSESELIKMI